MYWKTFLLVVLIISSSFLSNQALAVTPEDYCKEHNDANAGGTCEVCGSACVKITGNMGVKIYKKCSEVQCTLTNSCTADCPDCSCD